MSRFRCRSRARVVAVALAGIVAVSSCSSQSRARPASPTKASAVSPAQAAELRKASISFADYQAAFRRYQSCMAKIGYPVDVIGTENRVYNYQLPASLGSDARANHCYDYEFGQVDQRWQVQNQDTSQTADIYRTCLAKHNLSTTGSLRVLVARVKAAGLDVTTC